MQSTCALPRELSALVAYRERLRAIINDYSTAVSEAVDVFRLAVADNGGSVRASGSRDTWSAPAAPSLDFREVDGLDERFRAVVERAARATWAQDGISAVPDSLPPTCSELDPIALWQHLESLYGGERSVDLARGAAVSVFDHAFALTGQQPRVRCMKSATVLSSRFTRCSILGRYDWGVQEHLSKIGMAFSAFGSWMEEEYPGDEPRFSPVLCRSSFDSLGKEWGRSGQHVPLGASCQAVFSGSGCLIEVISRRETIDFRIHPRLAERLNIFLSIHRKPEQAFEW